MNVFESREKIVRDYAGYIQSFINIADPAIRKAVKASLEGGKLWPEPLLQFNPAYAKAGTIAEAVAAGLLHPSLDAVFKGYTLYRHQRDAIKLGTAGEDFVVTSGTGSGKSLTYLGTIFHHLLSSPVTSGVAAIIVYPMNALINSQTNEIRQYQEQYEHATGRRFPITCGQYTGQEKEDTRQRMRNEPPQVLLTNYMMLELLLTRIQERPIRDAVYQNLRFLVFDELHTYRGRQGADVAMLIRRIGAQCQQHVTCIGTSATMVSVGSAAQQREVVAQTATTMFGRPFSPAQVVNETLARSLNYTGETLSRQTLAAAISAGIQPTASEQELRDHPVAIWVESGIALDEQAGTLVRRAPMPISRVVQALAEASGLPCDTCHACLADLLLWISQVNERLRTTGRHTILPFKLHQFIAQTGSVYTTLDQDEHRTITLEPGIYQHDAANKKPIFPNVFSRATGHPFICVSLVGDRLLPREFREATEEEAQARDGYLLVGDDFWDPEQDLDYLPDSWLRTTKKGRVPETDKAPFFPRKLYFDENGQCSLTKPMKFWGWFMQAPLLFDPTGGVFFDTKTNEGTKLTKLGNEGRSTSTTITAFSILNQLHDAGYQLRDQKLLSFTDNRQDAALQAGHFNDFVQVVQLRAGIHKALVDAPGHTLTYATIGEAVFQALQLPFLDYGNRAEVPTIAVERRRYEQTFQAYLFYRALADLRRSWRIVLPNLEQCALLVVDYDNLGEIAADASVWADIPIAGELPVTERRDFLTTVLDFFRLEYALHSENFLMPSRLKEYEKHFREQLRLPWTLDREEELREPYVIRLQPLNRTSRLFSKSMGSASALGKYLRQLARRKGFNEEPLQGENYGEFVLKLLRRLQDAGYLVEQSARSAKNTEVPTFRLRIDRIIWKLGDGETVKPDVVKRRSYKDQQVKPNTFFRDMYRRDFSVAKRLRAEDHTGQLNVATRQDREDRFRADWYIDEAKQKFDEVRIRKDAISALFCSPTMELGIDIGGLSVVHLRNAPPNAANYAQRAGRAGRSGQGALIFTYCSSYSPHDRHFFQHQNQLVAGAVLAPRLDLCNRELLLSHLNALAISEIGLPGMEATGGKPPSLMNLVEDAGAMPLQAGVVAGLQLSPATSLAIKAAFRRVVKDIESELRGRASDWYSEDWLDQNLAKLASHLDDSMIRWRRLYRSARTLLTRATQPIESGRLSVGSDEYKKHKRHQDQANRQLNLLRNDIGTSDVSEFYPYRYLASEGFLPGYNFTRLPLRVFVPSGNTTGEFISRPRAIALREFGPLNIIYHNGRKFRVSQLVVQDAESSLTDAKVSTKAGYYLTGDQKQLEQCPFSGVSLGDTANTLFLHDLLEMAESRAEETDRISCEEEERISRGFDVQTYFAVDGGDLGRIRRAVVRSSETGLLNLRFMAAARLVHVNTKWRAQKIEGFPIGLTSGDWRKAMPEPEENLREAYKLVKLWTSNVADALYVEPVQALGLNAAGVITLQHALRRAIETVFKAEPNEVGAVTMGDPDAPNILLYEAAEGSLGILSRFVEDVTIFHQVVAEALRLCKFDDDTYLAPASYDDLLSYYNQRDHLIVDRFLIKDALAKLGLATVELQTNTQFRNYEDQYQAMLRALDPNSSTERTFIQALYKQGLRLPDAAQKRVDGIYCQPDFYYEPRFWVFCDGSPHDAGDVKERDDEQRQAIMAKGDEVWAWHYREDLAAKLAQRPDIFRKVR